MKRTLGNSRIKRTRKSGFRARIKSKAGRQVLKRRRLKGRKRIAL
ncbi:MAG: 50S ribosomal protein L34 [Candidatus Melainabacteria bacterium]|nr:50S ribosomal protein L34 [Candidatus Melainabacteria bacterium]MBI3308478.1 50S ribosomal protein L34 [Candidatus Melainabacteria bacterium]